jgi:4-hydroxythreonine-4-phosphate dehydrogenase
MDRYERPLALTLGDPAGIGPDITLLAYQARLVEQIPPFLWLGDPDVLADRAEALGLAVPMARIGEPEAALERFAEELPVMEIAVPGSVVPGRPDAQAAAAIQHSIERAVALVRRGEASAIVTNPISKAVLTRAGFAFPGHTEFLGHLAGGKPKDAVMMLVSGDLRVVPVTIHLPLKDVPGALSRSLILSTLTTVARDAKRYFGLPQPRIAVTGLNPHAGEDGTMGSEEIDIILPAIEAARAQGLDVTGPHPADALFHTSARKDYDVAVAMYHDQALIPFKTLAFEEGVNVTLGLPFVRASPDHGTAFSLAGTGKASPRSLIEALRLADQMQSRARSPN